MCLVESQDMGLDEDQEMGLSAQHMFLNIMWKIVICRKNVCIRMFGGLEIVEKSIEPLVSFLFSVFPGASGLSQVGSRLGLWQNKKKRMA